MTISYYAMTMSHFPLHDEVGRACGHSAILSHMALPARDAELVQIMDASLVEAAGRAGAFLA